MSDRNVLGSMVRFFVAAILGALAMPAIGYLLTLVNEANAIQRAAQ